MIKKLDLKKNWFHYFAVSFFVLIVVVLFWGFFSNKNMMITSSDQYSQFGNREFFKTSIVKHKQFPTWNSSVLSGVPTIDAMFGDVLYFPVLPIKAMFPIHRAFVIKMLLHIMLAGILFYLMLVRAFRAPPLAAFTAALFYMLNSQFFSHIYPGHDGKMYVISLLPFVVWRMKALMDKTSMINASILAFSIGLSILTGHIQLAYFVLWGLFFYWVMHLFLVHKKNKELSTLVPYAAYFWGAVFTGLALSAVQFLPSMMYVNNEYSVRGAGKGFEYAASWSLHWPEVFGLWVPEFCNTLGNYWSENYFKLNYEYTGAMPLLFAIMAVAVRPKPWRFFWAGVAAFSLLFSLGAHTPIFHIAYYIIPGVKKFRACSMIMTWFSFSIIILSSFFFIDVMKDTYKQFDDDKKKKLIKNLLIALGAITVITLLFSIKGFVTGLMSNLTPSLDDPKKFRVFENNFSKNFVPFLWLWWFFAITSIGMFIAYLMGKINKNALIITICLIGVIDLVRVNSVFIEPSNSRPYFYTEPALKAIQPEMKEKPFRVFFLPGTFKQENSAGIHHLEMVGGFHDNELKWYRKFRGVQSRNYMSTLIGSSAQGQYLKVDAIKEGNNFLNLANVKYVITRKQNGELVTFKNENVFDRLSFARNFKVFSSEDEMLNELYTNGYDISNTIGLLKTPESNAKLAADSVEANFSFTWDKYTPNYRKAIVKSDLDGFLRLAEVYYPGWKIKIDGKEVEIFQSDISWMAVSLSKGEHTVEMYPKSMFLVKAFKLSIVVFLIILGYWIFYIIKKRKES